MLSLELARKLKEAGLVWEPQKGDLVYHSEAEESFNITAGDMEDYVQATRIDKEYAYSIAIFLPRLDQLLAEIEKRGWKYTLICRNMNGADEDYLCWVVKRAIPTAKRGLYGVTPTEAAASALLWICLKGS